MRESGGIKWLQECLKGANVPEPVQSLVQEQWQSFDRALGQEMNLHQQVCRLAGKDKMMKRVTELPGYGPIRAATLICYLDTPWRFKSKSALWKYVGIGLRRERSGEGLNIIRVEQECNRLLRNMVIGAAESAIQHKENVFAERYAQWIQAGLSSRNARRNVAREQVTAVWGMWKSDKAFDAKLIHAD
jgi:transposase